ncbi:condensin subunit ScpA [Planifilum fimeticola]|jgi:segregation and condensation protein A|uniref:Segregation and condensation protein A n=1 Tax=Planifilum fimeticola TaxID=201975 RepID=A0A2T0LD56_9BACL|nr:segregation/condensation protein A [Planifilum fimeticola]PRX39973.1 condensin subunit ScpA [Planifilum fimeticola]
MDVTIRLEGFEGPLDLLLHLIEQSELDVCEVPIARITDQYMAYLSAMREWELEIASEFLVMAATLLAIKSRMLLPRTDPEEAAEGLDGEDEVDPREELVERLLEYKKYKQLAEVLREFESRRSRVYTRPPADLSAYAQEENPVGNLTPDDLFQAFVEVLSDRRREPPITRIVREEISVGDRMEELLHLLSENGGTVRFSRLLRRKATREQIVTTFLALLELMKMKRVICRQEQLFDEIIIVAVGEKGEGLH